MMIEDLIIPAAGKGLRMKKVNPHLPKEMLLINHRPMIQYAVEEAILTGIKNVYIVINKKKEIIRRYLTKIKIPLKLYFVYQQGYKGAGDAINCAVKKIRAHKPFAVILPDALFFGENPLIRLMSSYREDPSKNYLALIRVKKKDAKFFQVSGLIKLAKKQQVYEINKFLPKKNEPLYFKSNFIIKAFPKYIFQPEFSFIFNKSKSAKGEIDDIPLLNLMAKNNNMLGVEIKGRAFDVGNPDGFEYCNNFLKKKGNKI